MPPLPRTSVRLAAPKRALTDMDLAEVLGILRRRAPVILLIVFLVVGGMASFFLILKPTYTAGATLVIDGNPTTALDLQAAVTDRPQDEATLNSEIEVIRSRSLAARVVQELQLGTMPEFNAKLRPHSTVIAFLKRQLPVFKADSGSSIIPAQRRAEYEAQKIVDAVITRTNVLPVPRSRAVTVTFTSENPELPADVANRLAELYLTARLEYKLENAKRASTWLSTRINEQKENVAKAETAVENYRKQHELFQTHRGTLLQNQIGDLNSRLMDVTVARQAAEVNLSAARRLLNSSHSGEVETASEVLNSPLVQRFREEQLALERKEAELSEQLGARHPQMIQLQAEKKRLNERLKLEIGKIISNLENSFMVLRGRESALNTDVERAKLQLAQANQASVGLESLERNAEASRLLLQKFTTAFLESNAQDDVGSQLPDARVISEATLQDKPSFPKKAPMLAIAFGAAIVLGVMVAFLLEHLDAGFRSAEQIEEATGFPVLAHVPSVSRGYAAGKDLSRLVIERPKSAFADAIRTLTRTSGSLKPETKVILFTSAVAHEGKTTTALALARHLVQLGRRVVLVDADFHRSPVSHWIPGISLTSGISDYLRGTAVLAAILQSPGDGTPDVISVGSAAQQSLDGVWSPRLPALLHELRQRYDTVLIDSAPVLAVAATNMLAAVADATVVVVAWGSSRRGRVVYALNQIARCGGRIHGLVLSKVDVKKHAAYEHGDSGYYYGDVGRYHEV